MDLSGENSLLQKCKTRSALSRTPRIAKALVRRAVSFLAMVQLAQGLDANPTQMHHQNWAQHLHLKIYSMKAHQL